MKITIALLLVACIALARAGEKLFDENLAKDAVAVIRVHKFAEWPVPKYPLTQYHVHVYEVFKNESKENLNKSMWVDGFKEQDGVPAGECTLYLTRYDVANGRFDKTNGTVWMLVGGNATNGVSHVDSKAKFR
jgi:hypothetical protein